MFAYSYHELFGKLQGDVGASIDQLGELASIKGVAVNAEVFSEPPPKITSSDPAQLVNGVLNLLDEYKIALQNLSRAAEQNYERGVVNAVDDLFTQIDVIQYLLEASLPVGSDVSDHAEPEPKPSAHEPYTPASEPVKAKKKARKRPE